MRMASKVVLVGAVVGALGGAVLGAGRFAGAQSQGGSQAPLQAINASITDSVRLDVSATTAPGTFLAVAGDSGGARLEVAIPSPVALDTATLAALNGRFCTPGGQGKEGISGTVVGVPPVPGDGGTGAMQGRTSISVSYPVHAGSGFLSCYASALDGGVPSCSLPAAGTATNGTQIDEGGSFEMEVSENFVVHCLLCTNAGAPSGATAIVSYVEMDCYQP